MIINNAVYILLISRHLSKCTVNIHIDEVGQPFISKEIILCYAYMNPTVITLQILLLPFI